MPPSPLAPGDVAALRRLLWAPQQPPQDVARWLQQGFAFGAGAFPLGLVQGHGGPCGVLAAVQAELLRRALFADAASLDERRARLTANVALDVAASLVQALASLLWQLRGSDGVARVVSCSNKTAHEPESVDPEAFFASEFVETAVGDVRALEGALGGVLEQLRAPQGVVLFVWSALRSKGVARVREDMDDADSALTGQFGHCGQELLNLLLTGVASSNVFDGSVPMGDTGLMLRGVAQRPRLGYLTQLEALRYCQVGNYYKSPQFPVWVVGSASHFSVCFGLDMALCEASASLMLFQRMQRVFKAFDPMEAGFMEMGSLADSLRQLGVRNEILTSDYWMAQLCSRLEVAGAGIILWDEYWRLVSVLVHTNDIELALSGKYRAEPGASDAPRAKSDEELARELQAQFDTEERGGVAAAAVTANETQQPGGAVERDDKERFEIYYYNGLVKKHHGQGTATATHPKLVKASVKVEATREFIGDTVPIELSTATGDGGHGGHPLEDILRTKWPSATFFSWEGSSVPSVD